MKKKIRELFPELTAAVLLTVLSAYLLGGDVWTFWTWWLLALFMGNGGNAGHRKAFWWF